MSKTLWQGNVIFTIEGLFHKMVKTKCLKKVYPVDFKEVSSRFVVLVGNCASWWRSPLIFHSTLNSCLLTCFLTNLCSAILSSFLISNISLNVTLHDLTAYGNHNCPKRFSWAPLNFARYASGSEEKSFS